MRSRLQTRWRAAALACALLVALAPARSQRLDLGPARPVAPGVDLHHLTDARLLDPAAPVSVWILRVDPARADIRAALTNGEVMGTETVAETASRHKAIAAINAGFFLPNGDPAGVLTIGGRLVSETRRARGALGILAEPTGLRLIFARLRASAALAIHRSPSRPAHVTIDGVDTTRLRGRTMLFTPAYHEHTDTAPGGLEWVLAGKPLRVVSGPHKDGRTPIPPDGFVLSFGGTEVPASLRALRRGTRVSLDTGYAPVEGSPDLWLRARDIVGGAGLLIRGGEDVADWSMEEFNKGFAELRHPRTMAGVGRDGDVWLVTVDGRQPQLSAGMSLTELRALARRLDLTDALNLDGGGSTTMWVDGTIVNSPSDATGPRKVGDALLVLRRDAAAAAGRTPAP